TTAHTLRRLARQGRSPVLVRRIGGRWIFSRRSVEEFIDGHGAEEAS
ncbi:MAG: helix-turn-helix domain-containing protein, partial [Solirubrobacterales bacterium]